MKKAEMLEFVHFQLLNSADRLMKVSSSKDFHAIEDELRRADSRLEYLRGYVTAMEHAHLLEEKEAEWVYELCGPRLERDSREK